MVKKVAVIGAGPMGHGIGQVLVMAGLEVVLTDLTDEILTKAKDQIRWSLKKLAEKGRLNQDVNSIMSKIRTTTNLDEALKEVDLVIESVSENLQLKKKVFSSLDEKAPEHAILASNTSSLSITEMAKATRRGNKVVGMHFFMPPVLMRLVEVIKGDETSQEVVNTMVKLTKRLGKTPIVVEKDVRGFVVNRILMATFNEAFWTVYRDEATIEDVDAAMKNEAGFPMGPFELADYIGLDIVYETSKNIEEVYGITARTCPIIEHLIKEGKLGKKTGKGFYDWSTGRPTTELKLSTKFDLEKMYAIIVNEAARLIHGGVAVPKDIDTAMKLGTSWPLGPLELADKIGIETVLNKLKVLHKRYSDERYSPCPLLEEYLSKKRL
ncbi:3-hydroxyacyl-CoA dehydrogenase [Candidatus Bathyarchaeota archaeon]|nr:3-hydroxyacyl-CoA dehydrogenase [Candidatus Bathyarchaeota archaeon]